MNMPGGPADSAPSYPVTVNIQARTEGRNRLTAAFRFFLAIPHLILVGGPIAVLCSFSFIMDDDPAGGSAPVAY